MNSTTQKPLFVPLNAAPYERFADGSKTFELRCGPKRWNTTTVYTGRPVTLSKGYGKQNRIHGTVGRVFTTDDTIFHLLSQEQDLYQRIMPNARSMGDMVKIYGKLMNHDFYTVYADPDFMPIAFEFIPNKGPKS